MMEKNSFTRCTPEEAGIPSSAVMRLLDQLEYGGFTEMHGLMIMRGDRICTEGWWAPYAPGLQHVLYSLSKTWTATAIGLAEYAGLLSVTDRVCDILPEYMPEILSERAASVTIRDLLTMTGGSETERMDYGPGWKEDFFARNFEHEPGTFWFYNTHGTAILSAIVEKVTHMSMIDWLDQKLFSVIGVDRRHILCRKDQDGTCLGGHGMFATTEDNLRLMRLYLHGGVWENVRLLSRKFAEDAVRPQADCAPAHAGMPWFYDNCCGYGYQIWMTRPEGAYRADGAFGQFAVVVPKLDLIVSITEAGYIGKRVMQNTLNREHGLPDVMPDHPVPGPQSTLDALFEILIPAIDPSVSHLPPSHESRILQERLHRLAIPRPAGWVPSDPSKKLDVALVPDGEPFSFGLLQGLGVQPEHGQGVERLYLVSDGYRLTIRFLENGKEHLIEADMRGGFITGRLDYSDAGEVCSETASAAWWDGDQLHLSVLWTETVSHNRYTFDFGSDCVNIRKWTESGISDPLAERLTTCRILA
ncbi:MAG: serine hydrolase [Clostridia bacterium]|nr:serine hydrolase [Clostridia bacterium]